MSTIAAGTTSTTALVSTGDTTGKLTFQTNGTTTAMTIDTSQNVGIGTSSPGGKFEVQAGRSWFTANSEAFSTYLRYNTSTAGVFLGSPSADAFQISKSSGAAVFNIDSSGNVGIGTSSPVGKLEISGGAANTYFRIVDTRATYPSYIGAEQGALVFGQWGLAERMRLNSDGNLGVGTTGYSNVRLNVVGQNTSSANWTVYAENSSNALLLGVRNDGAITTGSTTLSPYNNTTGLSANVLVGSDGFLYRSTSSLRYKSNVQDATHGLADVLKLRSVTYNAKNSGDALIGGLIAEEVDAAGLKEFVAYDKDGQPDALHYGNMVALLTKAIQELKAEVDALKAQLAKV